ncbi:hypothetical protein D3C76_1776350 [compost metagenome]
MKPLLELQAQLDHLFLYTHPTVLAGNTPSGKSQQQPGGDRVIEEISDAEASQSPDCEA